MKITKFSTAALNLHIVYLIYIIYIFIKISIIFNNTFQQYVTTRHTEKYFIRSIFQKLLIMI